AVPKSGALLARRRPRSSDEATPWLAHSVIDGPMEGYETDRAHFFRRGGTRVRPRALVPNARPGLSGTTGNVLDPLFSIRTTVELGPGESKRIVWALGAGEDREELLGRFEAMKRPGAVEKAFGIVP
ncbi:MAG: hypothetical protein QUU85_14045, partial [Candidatus Eisenbacteria bacterium]|nr:hypothetical protein [Candidatus Eisenbacteria bacterium]